MDKPKAAGGAGDVRAFLDALDHPHKRTILALRDALLGIDPAIGDEIKWNAPSFRVTEHFATMNLRAKNGVLLILHLGAQKAVLPAGAIADPGCLLKWLGPDRASIAFRDIDEVAAKKAALAAIVRQWIVRLPAG